MGMTNEQTAIKWAKTQGEGKSSNGNLNYCGHIIRSYSTPIAAIITNPSGKSIALVTSDVYSVTTSGKHMPAVRSALRDAGIPQYMAPESVLRGAERVRNAQDAFRLLDCPEQFERLENNYNAFIAHAEKKASRARTSREFWEYKASNLGREWVELSSFLTSDRA